MADEITKEQVFAKLGRDLSGELKEHTGNINGVLWPSWGKDEKVWMAYPPDNIGHVGASRIIVVSQKTGKVLVDTTVGE